jgi:BirA family biotin operon repressor/biotin-[acetyl-CoA-carboxylase] ligase
MRSLSTKLIELVDILNDREYHDGDTIGERIGVSRAMVWKLINKLSKHNIQISSVKNKGYALQEPLTLLNEQLITKKIDNPNIQLKVLENVDSTNNYLKKNLHTLKRMICLAETQSDGRGRMSRSWHSPFGQNIYMSYSYPIKKDISELNGLSLVISLAMLAAIKEIGISEEIKLKWPNDGIYDYKKLMGNLIEVQAEAYGSSLIIIGIGINVNMLKTEESISQPWTSLREITGKYIDRNLLCISLIHNLNYHLEQFLQYGLQAFISKWQEYDLLFGEIISLNEGGVIGTSRGINQQGNLLLETSSGEIKAFSSGETSICKTKND